MQMGCKLYLENEFDFAVLCRNSKDEVWQVYGYYKHAIKALSCVAMLCKDGYGKVVFAESGLVPILFEEGRIIDWYWKEWEVEWKR